MINPSEKIIRIEDLTSAAEQAVVLCYGHFNIIHPGHIRYLEYARNQGSRLVVALQGDSSFLGLAQKHHFTEQERAIGVASLQFVDEIVVLAKHSLADVIRILKPKHLVLGKEFERQREYQAIEAIRLIQQQGASVLYDAGETQYASSDLLGTDALDLGEERLRLFRDACQRQNIQIGALGSATKRFGDTSLLVIGDAIVDQYIACDPVGMSAEAPVIVVKELVSREYVGGAGIVAAHIRALGARCHFLSVVGQDTNASLVERELNRFEIEHCLIEDASRPTTLKTRYMVENQKLFRVSRLKEHSLSPSIEEKIVREIERITPNIRGIVVSDFVYGVITPRIIETINSVAARHHLLVFGDLQCSSQIGNVGKFRNFDLLCPTEREARIALGNKEDGLEWIARTLIQKTKSRNLIMKLGAEGFIAYETEADGFINRQHFPALNTNPVDPTGAGDSLLAAASVALCTGTSLMQVAAIVTCMTSLVVGTLGNIPISLERLQNRLNTLNINP